MSVADYGEYAPTYADAMVDAGFVFCDPCRDWVSVSGAEQMGKGEYLCRPHAEAQIAAEEARRSP